MSKNRRSSGAQGALLQWSNHPERSEGSAFSCVLNDMAGPRKQQMLRFAQHDPAIG
jgi:hypothetical protein